MQTRVTKAEEEFISLIGNNLRSARPSQVFIHALNEQLRKGTKNPPDNNQRIYVENPIFIDALKEKLDGQEISNQVLFEICKALCQQGTFDTPPIRTEHVFNFLYEELIRRHKFYVAPGGVPDKIPDDINAINYELLQYFRKAFPGASEQNMCNCLLIKIAPDALSNVASDEQINALLHGIRGLQAPPQVSQQYFDRVDKGMKGPSVLEQQLRKQYQSANPDAAASKPTTAYTYSAKKAEKPDHVRSVSAPAAVTNTRETLYSKAKNFVRSASAPTPAEPESTRVKKPGKK